MGNKTFRLSKSVFLVLLFLFVATQLCENLAAETKIDRIKKAGILVVGTSADYPPYEFHMLNDKDGELVGIDIDIAKAIAGELGVKLEVRDLIFSRLFENLESGQIDLAIAGLHPTEERKLKAHFSDIYYQAIQSVVIKKENTEIIRTIEDLRGKKVGSQKDSIQEAMARDQIPGAEFVVRETIEELVIVLKKGLLDAIILERPVAESYVFHDKSFIIIKCKQFEDILGSAIAVNKADTDLLAEVNRILEKLKKEDKITEFVENAKIMSSKH